MLRFKLALLVERSAVVVVVALCISGLELRSVWCKAKEAKDGDGIINRK